MKKIDILTAEIGSTTTVVTAVDGVNSENPEILGQGQATTTVLDGDVTIGLGKALANLEENLQDTLTWNEMVAASSAAGGLKMTVHGLVYDMTVKAAKEAALGAGANLHWVTAGNLTDIDVQNLEKIRPNIILLAGGVDYGEKNTVIHNAKKLTALKNKVPVIYAGNIAARPEIAAIFDNAGVQCKMVENVYPEIDQLHVEPTRRAIHEVFEEHIVMAPGMQKIRSMVNSHIIPTPGAVMKAAQLLYDAIGDLMVLDVGGATTDVHSVTDGDQNLQAIQVSPEPKAKRTVEGDLGVYINAENILNFCDKSKIAAGLQCSEENILQYCISIPTTTQQIKLSSFLTKIAVETAVARHAGAIDFLYSPTGRVAVVRGKDLSKVAWVIGTGGALTKLPDGQNLLKAIKKLPGNTKLLPEAPQVLLDRNYFMAAAGLLAGNYPYAAQKLLKQSLQLNA